MKAEIKHDYAFRYWYGELLNDKSQVVGQTINYVEEQEAIEGVKRNFPAFRLDGEEKPTLPGSWCVLDDGSEEFMESVIRWMNEKSSLGGEPYDGCFTGEYYGCTYGITAWSAKPFGTVLTLDQFKEMAQSPTT